MGLAVRCQTMGGRTASLTTRKALNTIVPESSVKAGSAIPLLTYRLSESLVVTAKQGIITGRQTDDTHFRMSEAKDTENGSMEQ